MNMNVTSEPNGQLEIVPKPILLKLAVKLLAVKFVSGHIRFYDTKHILFLLGLASQIRGVKVRA